MSTRFMKCRARRNIFGIGLERFWLNAAYGLSWYVRYMERLKFTEDELVNKPESRTLVLGKIITAFNVKITEKTVNLNTGVKFEYENELYEIMNREPVQSTNDYLKFNCTHLPSDKIKQD